MSQRFMSAEITESTFDIPGTAVPLIGIASGVPGPFGGMGSPGFEPHAASAVIARAATARLALRRLGQVMRGSAEC
jgi:hypothetical protein